MVESKADIESPYSKQSFQDFIDNILSIQYTLYGASNATSAKAHSIMAYAKSGNSALADALEADLKASVAALNACKAKGAFVDIYADSSVQDAMDAIEKLDTDINNLADWFSRQ